MSKFYAILLLAYFIFTSGLVYEAMGSNITDRLVIPYNFALSGERTGLVGVYTQDDIKCAEWIVENNALPIAADANGRILMFGYTPWKLNVRDEEDICNSETPFIFLTTWNTQHRKIVTVNLGEGLRGISPLPDMATWIEAFRSGQSVVYRRGLWK
jgi:hypothetical protein